MESAPSPSPAALETISANLRMILRGMLAAMGAWRLEGVLAIALYRHVGKTMSRIERLLVRFRAGRLWRVTHRDSSPKRRGPVIPGTRLPRRFGWLVMLGKHHAACVGSQLQVVLSTPEMVELLAVSPQAVRILRPLCRALAMEVPGVSSGVRAERGEKPLRKRKPRPKPEPFRIPLPRGVLSAARRQGFGKLC